MRVLITGGAGFIGANLVRECERAGHDCVVLDNLSTGYAHNLDDTAATFIRGDIRNLDTVTSIARDTDAIVHLAARGSVPRSLQDPIATHEVNATGTLNVLEAARAAGGQQVILASSSSVYGANAELPKRESAATRPMSPYAASKLAAESMALSYRSSFDMAVVAFRFFNVFGPLQAAGHAYAAVIPAFVDAALRGAPLSVHGTGEQSRDFTHVSTVCSVIRRTLEGRLSSPDPVNLAFGTNTSLLELIELIGTELDLPLVVDHVESRVGDVPHSQADSSLLDSLVPGIEPVDFVTGLRETIDWMRTVVDRSPTSAAELAV